MFPKLLRATCWMIFCVALLSVLGGGSSCSFCSGSLCDDDDTNDDDDDSNLSVPVDPTTTADDGGCSTHDEPTRSGPLTARLRDDGAAFQAPALSAEAYRLTRFDLVEGADGWGHPVAALRRVQGVNVNDLWAPPRLEGAAFRAFTAELLAANPFLDLPAGAGHLVFAESWIGGELVVVRWRQEVTDLERSRLAAPPGELSFVFDLFGNLLQVENTTQLPPGVELDVPLPTPVGG